MKNLAAVMMLMIVGSMLSARADDLETIEKLVIPAPYELVATGIGPDAISVGWKDATSTEMAFELQWTKDPSREENWYPARKDPIEHNVCSSDNTGAPPTVNVNDVNDPLNPYSNPSPARCQILLTKLRNRTNTADVPLPYAEQADHVYWFRIRGITPYKLRVPVPLPGQQNLDFPEQVRAILKSPWSGIDPAILGPLPPTNVQLFASFPSVTVVWANAASGDPYFTGNVVERSDGPTLTPSAVSSGATSFLDGPLEYNKTYRYRVSSQRTFAVAKPADPNTGAGPQPDHVEFAYSASAPASAGMSIVTPPIPAPGDPTNLIATFTAPSTSNLQWMDNANDEDGFLIQFGPANGSWVAQTAMGPHQGTGFMTFSQYNIPADTIRWYRVLAFRATPYATSGPSNSANIVAIPKGPTGLVVNATSSFQTVLKFKDNSVVEDAFQFEFCNPAVFPCGDAAAQAAEGWTAIPATLAASPGSGGMVTFVDGRFANSTLKYRVRAFNTSGYSAPSNAVSSATPSAPLNAPSNLTATASGTDQHRIDLQWQDNTNDTDGQPNTADDQEEAFRVEYQDPGQSFSPLVTVSALCSALPPSSTTPCIDRVGVLVKFTDKNVPGKTTRCYRVRAIIASQARQSDPSNRSCAMTIAGPLPAAPTNLIGVPWSVNPTMAVQLTWDDNAGPDTSVYSEDGYIVEHSNNNQTWREIGRTGRNATIFRYGNFDPNSVQFFRVKAYNYNGESAYSNTAQVLLKGPPRPVWIHPSKDNSVSTSQCSIDGSFAAGFVPNITDIQISIVRKVGADVGTYRCNSTPSSCTYDPQQAIAIDNAPPNNQVQFNWNGPGTFKLDYHFFKNVTYELHARAVNSDGASADAYIPSFVVLADCPLGP